MAGPGVGQTVGTNADVANSTAQQTIAGLENQQSQRRTDSAKISTTFSPPNSDGKLAQSIVQKDVEFTLAHTQLLLRIAEFTRSELAGKGIMFEEDSATGSTVAGSGTGTSA